MSSFIRVQTIKRKIEDSLLSNTKVIDLLLWLGENCCPETFNFGVNKSLLTGLNRKIKSTKTLWPMYEETVFFLFAHGITSNEKFPWLLGAHFVCSQSDDEHERRTNPRSFWAVQREFSGTSEETKRLRIRPFQRTRRRFTCDEHAQRYWMMKTLPSEEVNKKTSSSCWSCLASGRELDGSIIEVTLAKPVDRNQYVRFTRGVSPANLSTTLPVTQRA